jgi:hypothetical protein
MAKAKKIEGLRCTLTGDGSEIAAADGWGNRDRLDWLTGSRQPHHITANRANGLWVVTKCGVYRTLDALFEKQREMVEARDIDNDIVALRFGLELRRQEWHPHRRSGRCTDDDFDDDDLDDDEYYDDEDDED